MNDDEYKSLKPFENLPLFDDSDPRCETIDKVDYDTAFTGSVLEANSLGLAHQYLSQNDLVPKGAIRHHGGNDYSIFVYFWRKRT